MNYQSPEYSGPAKPYLELIVWAIPSNIGKPDRYGFVEVGKRVFLESLRRLRSEELQFAFPGRIELIDLLEQTATNVHVSGIGVLTYPIHSESPVERLSFIVVCQPGPIFAVTPLADLSHALNRSLGKGKVPLYSQMSFSQIDQPAQMAEFALKTQSNAENFAREFGDPLPTQHYLLAFH